MVLEISRLATRFQLATCLTLPKAILCPDLGHPLPQPVPVHTGHLSPLLPSYPAPHLLLNSVIHLAWSPYQIPSCAHATQLSASRTYPTSLLSADQLVSPLTVITQMYISLHFSSTQTPSIFFHFFPSNGIQVFPSLPCSQKSWNEEECSSAMPLPDLPEACVLNPIKKITPTFIVPDFSRPHSLFTVTPTCSSLKIVLLEGCNTLNTKSSGLFSVCILLNPSLKHHPLEHPFHARH